MYIPKQIKIFIESINKQKLIYLVVCKDIQEGKQFCLDKFHLRTVCHSVHVQHNAILINLTTRVVLSNKEQDLSIDVDILLEDVEMPSWISST